MHEDFGKNNKENMRCHDKMPFFVMVVQDTNRGPCIYLDVSKFGIMCWDALVF